MPARVGSVKDAADSTKGGAYGQGCTDQEWDNRMTYTVQDRRFTERPVLVTGGTSGIGEQVVRRLVAEGAHVVFCGLDDKAGKALEQGLCKDDGVACYIGADVRDDAGMARLVAQVVTKFGGLSLAVNCAGISHLPHRLAEIEPAVWRDVMATNCDGIFYAMRHEIPAILSHEEKTGAGAIVNIASILGTRGAPWLAAYGASKHAVISITLSAARDYAAMGLRINAVSPGPVDTPMLHRALRDIEGDHSKYAGGFPPGGSGSPNDVADAVLFLLSRDAAYINGANLLVDGATSAL